jgi:hypothetical protein
VVAASATAFLLFLRAAARLFEFLPRAEVREEAARNERQRAESGRYLLQVDRQTKGSYPTAEAAQSAALVIKKGYPVVQVSVYDRVGNTSTLVELPVASS